MVALPPGANPANNQIGDTEMKFKTITEWVDLNNNRGNKFLESVDFDDFNAARRLAESECRWEYTLEAVVVCTTSNKVLWSDTGDYIAIHHPGAYYQPHRVGESYCS